MQLDRRLWMRNATAAVGSALLASSAESSNAAYPDTSPTNPSSSVAKGRRYAVATVAPEATRAAMAMFEQGGNAADAAVAAGLMLSVVDGHNSGIGGGCFILARTANGELHAIDGREMAPGAAHSKMFWVNGQPDNRLSQEGPLASGIPGAVAAYYELSQRAGTGLWSDAANLAADVAEDGYRVSKPAAARLRSVTEQIKKFPATRQIFLKGPNASYRAGDLLVQRDLAKTMRELAEHGPDAFYRGRFAEQAADWMQANGGLLTRNDFANYRTVQREPIRSSFRGCEIVGFPPPSSGGVHVAQILSFLERFDLRQLASQQPALYYHVVGEAMRLAFADRAVFLGDPDFANVPRGLLDPEYLATRGASIQLNARMKDVRAGMPPRAQTDLFEKANRHTTHFTAADAEGNWIAITATVNTTLGSKVVIPGTGVVMNNQMDDFAIAPGVPNAFGLVGTDANAPEAGKRPLSSMSPSIALRDGKPVVTCGAAGGPRIISAAAQILLRKLACDTSVEAAVALPRVHHQWRPDELRVEPGVDAVSVAQLESLGHTVKRIGAVATAQAIAINPDGEFTAAAESRLPGFAAAK